nr:hypothetical protein [Bacteroides acidifaciens]
MKYWIGALTFVVILLGIGYLNLYCRKMEFDGDSAGVIISALGVLVTALVGWQVYNAIEMRGIIDKVNNVKSELNDIAVEHRNKISRTEWLASALHGTTFERATFEGGDTAYFRHCLTVIGNFIKCGEPLDSPPFRDMLNNAEATFKDIKESKDSHKIMILGADKKYIRKWYQAVINTIDTESKHLDGLKERIGNLYDDYIVLTKDVVVKPHK